MNLKAKLISVFVLGILVLFIWLVMKDKSDKSYIYPDFGIPLPEEFGAIGIDVSHYQQKINWQQVSEMNIQGDSISFAYIKLTEGVSLVDKRANDNAAGAADANIDFGFYHFFHPDISAKSQAVFFCQNKKEFSDSLRPVVDIEMDAGYKPSRIVDSVNVFMKEVEKITGIRPLIYTYESFFKDVFQNSYLKYEDFWIANYNKESEVMNRDNIHIWQFSDKGTVNGIEGYVDLNISKDSFNSKIKIRK